MSQNQFWGAYHSVLESIMKLIATGTTTRDVYLSMQEYFHSIKNVPERWGQPFKALLGALAAQRDLELPAIGGKDSMSGSFEDMDVPPTLISFATTISEADRVISPEFKEPGHKIVSVSVQRTADGRVDPEAFKAFYEAIQTAIQTGKVVSAWSVGQGGIIEGLYKMAIGNRYGVTFAKDVDFDSLFQPAVGTLVLETAAEEIGIKTELLGVVSTAFTFSWPDVTIDLAVLDGDYNGTLEDVYPTAAENDYVGTPDAFAVTKPDKTYRFAGPISGAPKAVLAVFPGTNCEYDTARILERAGARVEPIVIGNLTAERLQASIDAMEKRFPMHRCSCSLADFPSATSPTAPVNTSPPSSATNASKKPSSVCSLFRTGSCSASATASRRSSSSASCHTVRSSIQLKTTAPSLSTPSGVINPSTPSPNS